MTKYKHKPPRLNNRETEHLSKPVTRKQIESILKHLSSTESPGSDGFTDDFTEFQNEISCKNGKGTKSSKLV